MGSKSKERRNVPRMAALKSLLAHTGSWFSLSVFASFPESILCQQQKELDEQRQQPSHIRQRQTIAAKTNRNMRSRQINELFDRQDKQNSDDERDRYAFILDYENYHADAEESTQQGEDTFLGYQEDNSKLMEGDQGIRGGNSIPVLPWYAVFQDSTLCGASLIWGDILLTASHCVDDNVSAYLGAAESGL